MVTTNVWAHTNPAFHYNFKEYIFILDSVTRMYLFMTISGKALCSLLELSWFSEK